MKIILEVKIYILLMLTACLLLIVREQVGVKVFSTYLLASIFGIKSIGCFITGKCYQEVYFFLITYSIINLSFVFYYQELKQLFEDTYNKIRNKKIKNNKK
jgi:hypothetical protein